MKKVQRFWSYEAMNIRCVREEDYDAAQAELAALWEELANTKRVAITEIEGLSRTLQRQASRNAALTGALEDVLSAYESVIHSAYCQINPDNELIEMANELLKPTESGASE